MNEPTEADKIAVLAEWAGYEQLSRTNDMLIWNPWRWENDWEQLESRLNLRSEPWQNAWIDYLESIVESKHADGGAMLRRQYYLATATPAEKSEALYRAIIEQKEAEENKE